MNRKKTVSFSKHSTNIFLHILTKCNLKCKHCYINPRQHGNNTLELSKIYTLLEIFGSNNNNANIVFLGGEPTLHPELSKAVRKARALSFNSITIDTNGYLFHDILSKVTPEEVDYISFSLDGATSRTNDEIRGKGSYSACTEGMKRAKSKGFTTSMIYTVSRLNIHELNDIVHLVEKHDIDRFFIQIIGIRGNSANKKEFKTPGKSLQISRYEWEEKVPSVAQKVADLGVKVIFPKVFLNPEEPFECAGRVSKKYFVFPNGRIYQCPLCEDFPLNSYAFKDNKIVNTEKINESDLFLLDIPEGCVMNRLIQPGNLSYYKDKTPKYKIACCLLKNEIKPGNKINPIK